MAVNRTTGTLYWWNMGKKNHWMALTWRIINRGWSPILWKNILKRKWVTIIYWHGMEKIRRKTEFYVQQWTVTAEVWWKVATLQFYKPCMNNILVHEAIFLVYAVMSSYSSLYWFHIDLSLSGLGCPHNQLWHILCFYQISLHNFVHLEYTERVHLIKPD